MLAKKFTIQTDGETQSFTHYTHSIDYSSSNCNSRSNTIPCTHSASTMRCGFPSGYNAKWFVADLRKNTDFCWAPLKIFTRPQLHH